MDKNRIGILLLIVFFPYGLFYMWKNNLWSIKVRNFILVFYAILVVSSFFNTSNKNHINYKEYSSKNAESVIEKENEKWNLSAADVLLYYDWCHPNCKDPIAAFKFHSEGTFNYSTKAFSIGTRRGKWVDNGNGKVDLIYLDGKGNSSLIINSIHQFNIGSTIYLRY